MFLSCEGLTTAKIEFRDQVASSYALSHMFYGCSNLMDVWCNMRIGFTFDLTHEWLLGVAEGGTYHHSSLINSNLIVHDRECTAIEIHSKSLLPFRIKKYETVAILRIIPTLECHAIIS